MPKRIVFFNCFHNGDIHVSRGFVRQIMNKIKQLEPDTTFGYTHKMSAELLSDIPDLTFDRDAFKDREDIKIQEVASGTTPANWMFGIRVPGSPGYEQAEDYFKIRGIEIRPMFYNIFDHAHLKDNIDVYGTDCSNAITLNKECFILPSYPELDSDDQARIIYTVNEYLKTLKG